MLIFYNKACLPLAGLEPARGEPRDFESRASANSATAAHISLPSLLNAKEMAKLMPFDILS